MGTINKLLLTITTGAVVGLFIACGGSGGTQSTQEKEPINQQSEAPVAILETNTVSGNIPLEVVFTGSDSYDPDGDTLTFNWDFGNGSNSTLPDPPAQLYTASGTYTVTLTVEDSCQQTDSSTVTIEAVDSGVFVDEEEGIVAGLNLDRNIDENSPAEIHGDPQWVDGIDGSAMEFNAKGEYILLPDSDSLDLNDQGTVEVWVYPYTNIAAAGIVHKGVELDYSDEAYSLQYNNPGQVAFILTNESGKVTYVISNEVTLGTNQWHHIAAAWDLDNVYLYVDGALVVNRGIYVWGEGWKTEIPSDFAPVRNSDGGLMIGSQIPYDYRFDGIIDNVILYNRVLDSTEVEEHYNSSAP